MTPPRQLVTAVLEQPTCLECIAKRTSLSPDALERAIAVLERALEIRRDVNGRCTTCGRNALVLSIDAPPRPD